MINVKNRTKKIIIWEK